MTLVAYRMTPALRRRAALIVNKYIGRYPMQDFPQPMRGVRVALKIPMSNPDLRALIESFAALATAVRGFN